MSNSMENITSEADHTIMVNTQIISTTMIVIICNCFSICLMMYCIRQMYMGIEISHPVYATLFCNLVTVLAACTAEVLVLPFLKNIRTETFVKSGAALYAIFQGTCWLVLSVLRYLYIVHNVWLHKTFPTTRTLTALSVMLIYLIYGFSMSTLIPVLVHHGWPFKGMTEMDPHPRLVCIGVMTANETGILILSSIFYFLILQHRGGMGKNSVNALPVETNNQALKSNVPHCTQKIKTPADSVIQVTSDECLNKFGPLANQQSENSPTQPTLGSGPDCEPIDIMAPNRCHMDLHQDSKDGEFELEMARLEAIKKEQQRENEINSAIRSLSTNLIISLVFMGFTFLWPLFSELFLVIALALMKVLIPLIVTASNFVIIHRLLIEKIHNCMKGSGSDTED